MGVLGTWVDVLSYKFNNFNKILGGNSSQISPLGELVFYVHRRFPLFSVELKVTNSWDKTEIVKTEGTECVPKFSQSG